MVSRRESSSASWESDKVLSRPRRTFDEGSAPPAPSPPFISNRTGVEWQATSYVGASEQSVLVQAKFSELQQW